MRAQETLTAQEVLTAPDSTSAAGTGSKSAVGISKVCAVGESVAKRGSRGEELRLMCARRVRTIVRTHEVALKTCRRYF